jgi:hypothetical protein
MARLKSDRVDIESNQHKLYEEVNSNLSVFGPNTSREKSPAAFRGRQRAAHLPISSRKARLLTVFFGR